MCATQKPTKHHQHFARRIFNKKNSTKDECLLRSTLSNSVESTLITRNICMRLLYSSACTLAISDEWWSIFSREILFFVQQHVWRRGLPHSTEKGNEISETSLWILIRRTYDAFLKSPKTEKRKFLMQYQARLYRVVAAVSFLFLF